jgi:predicted adenylyl cyclase CyaB
MPSNIEIKARDSNPARTRVGAERLSNSPGVLLEQCDTFFACPNGRLKLRRFSSGKGELIFYQRADIAGTKRSDYLIAPVERPEELAAVLAAAFGAGQTVAKTRVLFKVGQTRIHLDAVEGLGSYVELEVVLDDGQPAAEGHSIAQSLMMELGIRPEDMIDCAYVDLLVRTQSV